MNYWKSTERVLFCCFKFSSVKNASYDKFRNMKFKFWLKNNSKTEQGIQNKSTFQNKKGSRHHWGKTFRSLFWVITLGMFGLLAFWYESCASLFWGHHKRPPSPHSAISVKRQYMIHMFSTVEQKRRKDRLHWSSERGLNLNFSQSGDLRISLCWAERVTQCSIPRGKTPNYISKAQVSSDISAFYLIK